VASPSAVQRDRQLAPARSPPERRGNGVKVLTRSQVLARLGDYTTRHGAVSSRWIERNDPVLLRSIRVHFAGLPGARRAANISRPPAGNRRWSELSAINELRRIHRAGRVRMTVRGLTDAGHHDLVGAIGLYVGSIRRARRLARIPDPGSLPTDGFERWDDDRVIGEIRDRYRNGESLASSKVPTKLFLAAKRHCGGWPAAIEMAGLDYDQIRLSHRPWTRDDILARIRHAAHERAHNPKAPPMYKLIARIQNPIIRFFGDVASALRAAGIDPTSVMRHMPRESRSKKELRAEMRAAVRKQPFVTSTQFFNTRLGKEAVARFGSVAAAIKQIGPEHWTARRGGVPLPAAAEVIAGLRARYRRGDVMGYSATLREDQRLLQAALKRFGTWRRAMEAAGLGHMVGLRPPGRGPSDGKLPATQPQPR